MKNSKNSVKIYAKWPDPSAFDSIPHGSIPLPTDCDLLIEPEDIEYANVVMYEEEDDIPATNTVEMLSDVREAKETRAEPTIPVAKTPRETAPKAPPESSIESTKERWTAPKLYLDIVANDTAAFLASNAHVLSAEEFKAFAEDIKPKKKDDALPLLKTYLNTLRVRRTRSKAKDVRIP
jgi:hypothetical protein